MLRLVTKHLAEFRQLYLDRLITVEPFRDEDGLRCDLIESQTSRVHMHDLVEELDGNGTNLGFAKTAPYIRQHEQVASSLALELRAKVVDAIVALVVVGEELCAEPLQTV